ncbi:MAG: glycosyltransferase family 39 protein [bacterium]
MAAAIISGYQFMHVLKLHIENPIEKISLSAALGLGILSLLVFACGACSILYPFVLVILMVLLAALSFKRFHDIYNDLHNINLPKLEPFELAMAGLIILSGILSFIAALAPPNYYDSLVYHLALPAYYIRQKSIAPLQFNLFSYFPAHMEMLYTLALSLGGEITANLISWVTSVIALTSMYMFCARIFSRKYILLALLMFTTSPSVLLLSAGTYVDMGLAMYSLICIFYFYLWQKDTDNRSYFIISAICGGFAFSAKYTGAVCPVLLCSMMCIRGIYRKDIKKTLTSLAVYAGIAGSVSLPWLVKNIITVGNPVFPFFFQIFGWGNMAWTEASAAGYFTNFVEYGVKTNVLKDILALLVPGTSSLMTYGGGFDVLGDFGWTLPFIALPAAVMAYRKKSYIWFFGVYAVLHLIVWSFTGQVLRFLLPIFPIIIILGCAGLKELHRHLHSFILIVWISLFILSNFYIFFTIESVINPWHVALGIESRDEYLRRKYPDYYPAMEFINSQLDDKAKLYMYGDQRGYYCNRNYESSCAFAPERLVNWANTAKNSAEFVQNLKIKGFTHIFYNEFEANRLRSYGVLDFTDRGLRNWQNSIQEGFQIIYTSKYNQIYRIL